MKDARRGPSMPEQFLDSKAPGMLLVHGRDIIQPVKIRQRLKIGLVFDEFLGAADEEAQYGCPRGQQARHPGQGSYAKRRAPQGVAGRNSM